MYFKLGANAMVACNWPLNILRETVMGREVFLIMLLKIYFRGRWDVKHPTQKFFRTMEDAYCR